MSTENNKDFQWDEVTLLEYSRYLVKEYARSAEWSNDYAAEQYHLTEFVNMKKREKRSPEYEVLSYRSKLTDLIISVAAHQPDQPISPLYAIHSVRRLSDGEVFELGKNVQHVDGHYSAVITEFYLPSDERGEMWFYCDGQKDTVKNLNNFTNLPTPKPLFTTEDGVDLFSISDTVYGVCPKGTWETRELGLLLEPNKTNWKWFAIPYNRDRYVLLNKPTLSVSDVMDLYQNHSENFETFLSAVSEAAKAKL